MVDMALHTSSRRRTYFEFAREAGSVLIDWA